MKMWEWRALSTLSMTPPFWMMSLVRFSQSLSIFITIKMVVMILSLRLKIIPLISLQLVGRAGAGDSNLIVPIT